MPAIQADAWDVGVIAEVTSAGGMRPDTPRLCPSNIERIVSVPQLMILAYEEWLEAGRNLCFATGFSKQMLRGMS